MKRFCIWNLVDRSVLFCFIWRSRGVSSDRQNLPKLYSNVIFSHFNGFRLPFFYKGIFIWMEFWKVLAIVFHSKKRRSKNVEMRKYYILIYFLEGFTFSTPAFCWPHRDAQMMPPGVSGFPPQELAGASRSFQSQKCSIYQGRSEPEPKPEPEQEQDPYIYIYIYIYLFNLPW